MPTLNVKVDGTVSHNPEVSLVGGESKKGDDVNFDVEPGSYTVNVQETESGKVLSGSGSARVKSTDTTVTIRVMIN